jgi:hypothetical protein
VEVRVGKAKLSLTAVEPIAPHRILLIVDESGSMNGPDKHLAVVTQTLAQLVGNLAPKVLVEYGAFNNKAAFGNRFTSNPTELRESVAQVREQLGTPRLARTALFDAIHEGLGRFDSLRPGDSILVLTDGGDNHSKTTLKGLRQELEEKGVRLFAVLIEWENGPPEETSTADSLVDLAELTGGTVHRVGTGKLFSPDEETSDLRRYWTEELLSGYVVHFNVPTASANERKWRLSAKTEALSKKKILMIYPKHLPACSLMATTR